MLQKLKSVMPSVDSSSSNQWWPIDGSAIYFPLIFSFLIALPSFGHRRFDALLSTDGTTLFNFLQCSYTHFFWGEYGTIFFLQSQKFENSIIILFIYFSTWFFSVFFPNSMAIQCYCLTTTLRYTCSPQWTLWKPISSLAI